MLLKNEVDCVTPRHNMHHTLPCSCRITPKPLFCSRRTSMLCPHFCSFSDLIPVTPSSSASLISGSSSYILQKCHRAFAHHFLCLQHNSFPRCQLGSLVHFIQISAQRSLDQKNVFHDQLAKAALHFLPNKELSVFSFICH